VAARSIQQGKSQKTRELTPRGIFSLPPLRRLLEARALRDLDSEAWRTSDAREFVERALSVLTRMMGADGVCLLKQEGADLRTVAVRSLPWRPGKVVAAAPDGLLNGESGALRELREKGFASFLSVPVYGPERSWGVLLVAFRRRRSGNRRFLAAVARRIGYVLNLWETASALERQVHFDQTTGLPNRRLLFRHLQRRLAHSGGGWLALIDTEDLGEVNDVWGFEAGDAVMRELAGRLAVERTRDVWVARCDTARFALVAGGNPNPELLRRIVEHLEQPVQVAGATVSLRFRAGVVRFPRHGRDARTLLRRGGVALLEARQRGERLVIYDPSLEERRDERLLLSRLRRSLSSGEGIELLFQPIFDIGRNRVAFVESLVRWCDPESGHCLSPDKFVPLVERGGLAEKLDRLVLTLATQTAERWRRELGRRAPRITVNVSPESLASPGFVDFAAELARRLPPALRPTLELTERLLADAGKVNAALNQLHEAGVRVLVDDLGSGYASLTSLVAMKVDGFKVDRSLLNAIESDGRARAVVRTMLQLGRDLNLPVIVEGVEHRRQLVWLRAEGCRYAQGYLLGRPLPASEVPELIRATEPWTTALNPWQTQAPRQPAWLDL